ncbi:MAG: hypothetical protein U1E76_10120 [Planctomycetota bacterium]
MLRTTTCTSIVSPAISGGLVRSSARNTIESSPSTAGVAVPAAAAGRWSASLGSSLPSASCALVAAGPAPAAARDVEAQLLVAHELLGAPQLVLIAADVGQRRVDRKESVRADLAVLRRHVAERRVLGRHVAVLAHLLDRRQIERACGVLRDSRVVPGIVLVLAAHPAVAVDRHVQADLVAGGAELGAAEERFQHARLVHRWLRLGDHVVQHQAGAVLLLAEDVRLGLVVGDVVVAVAGVVRDAVDRVAGEAGEAGLRLGRPGIHILHDAAGEHQRRVVASRTPLRRPLAHVGALAHLLERRRIERVVERREAMRRGGPLGHGIGMAPHACGRADLLVRDEPTTRVLDGDLLWLRVVIQRENAGRHVTPGRRGRCGREERALGRHEPRGDERYERITIERDRDRSVVELRRHHRRFTLGLERLGQRHHVHQDEPERGDRHASQTLAQRRQPRAVVGDQAMRCVQCRRHTAERHVRPVDQLVLLAVGLGEDEQTGDRERQAHRDQGDPGIQRGRRAAPERIPEMPDREPHERHDEDDADPRVGQDHELVEGWQRSRWQAELRGLLETAKREQEEGVRQHEGGAHEDHPQEPLLTSGENGGTAHGELLGYGIEGVSAAAETARGNRRLGSSTTRSKGAVDLIRYFCFLTNGLGRAPRGPCSGDIMPQWRRRESIICPWAGDRHRQAKSAASTSSHSTWPRVI